MLRFALLCLVSAVLTLHVSGDLGAKKEIFKGLSTLYFSWDVRSLYAIRSNAEAVAWSQISRIPFVTASQVGQGRVVFIASWNFFIDRNNRREMIDLYRRLALWVSRGKANNTQENWYLKSKLATASGTFHIFSHSNPYNPTEMVALIKAVKEGRANMIISVPSYSDVEYLQPLLKEAGVHVPEVTVFSGINGELQLPTADMLQCPIDSVQDAFPKLATASDSYFLCSGGHTFAALETLPESEMSALRISSTEGRRIADARRSNAESKAPTLRNPVSSATDMQWAVTYNRLYAANNLLANTNVKAAKVSEYPGEVDASKAKPTTVEITIDARFKEEIHATGYYLPPGATANVQVLSGSAKGWSILIGCWTDTPTIREKWTRFPFIHQYHPFRSGKIFSAFGGSVQIKNDKDTTGTVKLRISNVIEAPYMNLRDPATISQWDARLARSASPWTDIVGDMISYCLPTSYVAKRKAAEVEYMIRNVWDYAVKMQFEFKGEDWRQSRRERIVLDILPSYGYGHAGYPIVAWQDDAWALSGVDRTYAFKTGAWGTCHELGHNRQTRAFTWSATGEVTNNIFSLLGRDLVFKLPSHDLNTDTWDRSVLNKIAGHLRAGAPYDQWTKDPWIALAIYAQFAKHFGWGTMSQWMQSYTKNTQEKPPSEEKDVIDQWAHRMNQVTQMDLMPLYDFWSIPVSSWVRDAAKKYPCFLPLDWFTSLDNKSRYNTIQRQYQSRNCRSSALKVIPYTAQPDVRVYHALDVKVASVSNG